MPAFEHLEPGVTAAFAKGTPVTTKLAASRRETWKRFIGRSVMTLRAISLAKNKLA